MKVYEKNNRIIFDDYAHHPTEIEAVLRACKNSFKEKKIVSIFQPHRFTRVESIIWGIYRLLFKVRFG